MKETASSSEMPHVSAMPGAQRSDSRRATRPRRTCRRGSTRSRSPRTACRRLCSPVLWLEKGHAAALAVRRIRHFEQFGDGHVAGGGNEACAGACRCSARSRRSPSERRPGGATNRRCAPGRASWRGGCVAWRMRTKRVSDGTSRFLSPMGGFHALNHVPAPAVKKQDVAWRRRAASVPRSRGPGGGDERGHADEQARVPGIGGQGWGKALEAREGAGREEAQVRGRALRKVQGRGGGVEERERAVAAAGTRKGVCCGSRVLQVRARDRAPNARKVPS